MYSEATAQRIDQEAQAIVEHMYRRACQLLNAHREALEVVAQYLLQHEVIDQPTLATLLTDLSLGERSELSVA
jgi:cell division protease FtsH